MGGEREDYVTKKQDDNTESQGSVAGAVAGQRLRFHESAGQVHFHDDALKLKAAMPVADWWKAWERLRTTLSKWEYVDTTNDTILTIETHMSGEPPGVEAIITLTRGVFGTNFKALNAFTKRK